MYVCCDCTGYNMLTVNTFYHIVSHYTISTCTALCKYSTGRFMNKILKETKNKKKWRNSDGYISEKIPLPTNLIEGATEGKRSANTKRVAVLNKVFMRYITDLMATGNNASIFLGRGIEINRVKVAPDFKGINIFWIAKGTESDNELEELLNQNAGALRHELSQLRVMGVVPKLYFIKDKGYAKLIEVDERLAKADFGSDYVPVEPSYRIKSDLSLTISLPESVKEKINLSENYVEFEEEIPSMRNDIFGLNYSEIMSKVEKAMKKSQAKHRKQNENICSLSTTLNEQPFQFDSQRQQKEAFQRFLLKRQIQIAKAKKEKDKYNPEYEYFKAEKTQYYEGTPFSEELKDNDDYIEEEDTKNCT